MIKIVTGEEMSKIDHYTIDQIGIPSMVLMERAALEVATELLNRPKILKEKVLIVCGVGNNGGDGLALARMLYLQNVMVGVLMVGSTEQLSIEASKQFKIIKGLGVTTYTLEASQDYQKWINNADLIVDSIFGTGLTREIKGLYLDVIQTINSAKKYVLAIDIPSGIASDSGRVLGIAVKAHTTITFGLPKIGLILYPGTSYAGEVKVVDIGFPQKAYDVIHSNIFTFSPKETLYISKRKPRTNKGSYGKVLVIAGKVNMCGAAYLSAYAAYRMGTGLVTIMTDSENRQILQSTLPEAILKTFHEGTDGVNKNELEWITESIADADVVVIGPGMGQGKRTEIMLELVLKKSTCPVIIDADGLNALANHLEWLKHHTQPIITTPHPGEMARLQNTSTEMITEDLMTYAKQFSEAHDVICVLKDARTIVAHPNHSIYMNTTGNPGMATAGSGDVLTGIIASLIGQGMDAYTAACYGVYLHGLAGDKAKEIKGVNGMLARDVIEALSSVVAEKK